MKKVIKIIGLAIIIMGLLFGALFLMVPHDEFITIILGMVNLPEEKRTELSEILTIEVFQGIRSMPFLVSFFGILIFIFSNQINSTIDASKEWCYAVIANFKRLPGAYLLFGVGIIVLSFLFNLYNIFTMPIFFDEALTYQHFTKRSIFTSISHYPAPNNHILHSVLTNITQHFPFSRTINLRFPSLIVSLLSSLCFFYTFSKLLNVKTALFLLSIYCFLFPVAYYGYLSRGYALVLLAFIICFYSTIQLISSKEENSFKKYLALLSIGAIVGFYSIPSFLYPYFAISSFLTFYLIGSKDFKKWLAFTVSAAATFLIVFVLYLPVFLISGIGAVTNNEYVEPISRLEVFNQLIPHFSETSHFLFSIPLVLLLLGIVTLSAVFLFKKVKPAFFPFYCILVAPVILLLHSVIPFPRTWVFLTIPFLFIVGLFVQQVKVKLNVNLKTVILFSLLSVSVLVFNFRKQVADIERFSFLAQETAEFLIGNNATTVYGNRALMATNLKYIFEEKKEDIIVINLYEDSPSDTLITASKSSEYIITDKKMESVRGYKFVKEIGEEIFISKLE